MLVSTAVRAWRDKGMESQGSADPATVRRSGSRVDRQEIAPDVQVVRDKAKNRREDAESIKLQERS